MHKNPTEYNLTPKQNMKKKKDATESASNWKKETWWVDILVPYHSNHMAIYMININN